MKIKEIDNTEKIIISETNVIPGKIILFILDILLIVINSIIYDFPLFILYNEFLIFLIIQIFVIGIDYLGVAFSIS